MTGQSFSRMVNKDPAGPASATGVAQAGKSLPLPHAVIWGRGLPCSVGGRQADRLSERARPICQPLPRFSPGPSVGASELLALLVNWGPCP